VPFTIPGEQVRVRVRRLRDGTCIGVVDEILRPSPHRVTPKCPHFGLQPAGACGGCSWQHIAYPEQLRLKAQVVTRLLQSAAPGVPAARPTLPATAIDSPWGYRQKAHFVLGADPDGSLAMGHYARGTRRIVRVTACPVHDERGNALAFRFRDAFGRFGVAAGDGTLLRGLVVRTAARTKDVLATLVLAREATRRVRLATRQVIEQDTVAISVHVNLHARGNAYIFGDETRPIAGADRLREEVAGLSFLISPTAFFQTNVRAAEVVVRLVLDAIPHPSRVLDLYAGAGLFALPLARAGDQVVCVEENREAIGDGEASRRLNGITQQQCRFLRRRVEDAIGRVGHAFDAVVFDPPRAGCAPAVINGIFRGIAPPLAIYVSCNPAALARDLRRIVRGGYEVSSVQPVDMFPHTAHVETVVTLRRRGSNPS
jgi:23S rRNA (uracil1939-C5)-methyltransferase